MFGQLTLVTKEISTQVTSTMNSSKNKLFLDTSVTPVCVCVCVCVCVFGVFM
jgi:hypothetical protein